MNGNFTKLSCSSYTSRASSSIATMSNYKLNNKGDPLLTPMPSSNSPSFSLTAVDQSPVDRRAEVSSSGDDNQSTILNVSIPIDQLKSMLTQQLEYYFSRENLANDSYLLSQMDSDQYVPIWTVANFNQIKKLTKDLDLIVTVLRESPNVQVDDAGEKVRPNHKRCIVILREIHESTPVKEVEALFKGENCPQFVSCEFAHNNSWYVTFESDEDAQRAYCYLREDVKTFQGKSIMARIKAKPIARAAYLLKNGYRQLSDAPVYQTQQQQQQQQPPAPPHQQQQQQQQRYLAYPTHVPNMSYNGQQVPVYAFPPFYPPSLLQTWGPTNPACYDIGSVFSINGLAPQAAFKPLNSTGRSGYQPRSRYQTIHARRQFILDRCESSGVHVLSGLSTGCYGQSQKGYGNKSTNLVAGADYGKWEGGCTGNSSGSDVVSTTLSATNDGSSSSGSLSFHASLTSGMAGKREDTTQTNMSAILYRHSDDHPRGILTPRVRKIRRRREDDSSSAKSSEAATQPSTRPSSRFANERHSSSASFQQNQDVTSKASSTSTKEPIKPLMKFDLKASSFPPLPGTVGPSSTSELEVFENRMSDVVKGTAKLSTRDMKTQTSTMLSPLSLPHTTKETSTLTNGDALNVSTVTPLSSPTTSRTLKNVTMADKETKTDELIVNSDDHGPLMSMSPPTTITSTLSTTTSPAVAGLRDCSTTAASTQTNFLASGLMDPNAAQSNRSSITTNVTPNAPLLLSSPPSDVSKSSNVAPTSSLSLMPLASPTLDTCPLRRLSKVDVLDGNSNGASATPLSSPISASAAGNLSLKGSSSPNSIPEVKQQQQPTKLSYAQMAQRAKEKVEKIAQEQKEQKDTQERERKVRERDVSSSSTVTVVTKFNACGSPQFFKSVPLPRDYSKVPRDRFIADRFRKNRTVNSSEFHNERDRRRDRELCPKSPK